MKRIFLTATIVVALFAAAPAIAQGLGPNDAFIDQIGDSHSATVGRTGSLATGKGPDIDQISGNAAKVTHARKGKLNQSAPRATDGPAYVNQVGPDDLGQNDATVAEVGAGDVSTATAIQDRSRRSNAADLNSNIAPARSHEHAIHSVQKSLNRTQARPTAPSTSRRAQAAGGGRAAAKTSPR